MKLFNFRALLSLIVYLVCGWVKFEPLRPQKIGYTFKNRINRFEFQNRHHRRPHKFLDNRRHPNYRDRRAS